MTRSRLDYRASARAATAKGSAGDTAVMGLLQTLGYARYADLARTYPGADLLAICGCGARHLLWVESKAYSWRRVTADTKAHAEARAIEVVAAGDRYALFTYQKPNRYAKREWVFRIRSRFDWSDGLPFKSHGRLLRPSCAPPLPMAAATDAPASPRPIAVPLGVKALSFRHRFDSRLTGVDTGEGWITHDTAVTCQDPRCPNAPRPQPEEE